MYEENKNLIKNYNVIDYNKDNPTRKDAILDIIYVNKPEKVISFKVHDNEEGSDHYPISIKRAFKNAIDSQQYIKYRDMSKYNTEVVQYNLIYDRHHDYILHSNNSSESIKLLTEMLNDSLSVVAPIKKIKIKKVKEEDFNLSKETKEMIKNMDIKKVITKFNNNKIENKILNDFKKKVIK